MKLFTLLLLCLLSASCMTKVMSAKPVDTEKLSNVIYSGNSAIKGNIVTVEGHHKFIRDKGNKVVLVPVCEASTDIVTQIFGSDNDSSKLKKYPRVDWGALESFNKVVFTDDKGRFLLPNLSGAEYYIIARVRGGSLLRKIVLKNDSVIDYIIRY